MVWMNRKTGVVKEIVEKYSYRSSDYSQEYLIFRLNNGELIKCKFIPKIKVGFWVEAIGKYSYYDDMFVAYRLGWKDPQKELKEFLK